MPAMLDFDRLPAGALIRRGLMDLAAGRVTEASLLVRIGAPRLRRLGMEITDPSREPPEHALYSLLASADPAPAHSRYNALIRALVSFERAAECAT